MNYTGAMRVHFNRHGAVPLVWCVSTDRWEIAVPRICIAAGCETRYEPKATPDDEDGKPSAWISTYGTLSIDYESGVATICVAAPVAAEPTHPSASAPTPSNVVACALCDGRGIVAWPTPIGERPCTCERGEQRRLFE